MTFRHSLFFMVLIFISSCVSNHSNGKNGCSSDNLERLRLKAWEADRSSDEILARDYFERMCSCLDVEGCINASSHYSTDSPKWRSLNKQACDLENGNACFLLAESTSGDIAKGYYEKGCLFSIEHASAASCRMAGYENSGDHEKGASYFEKGCLLGDIKSCIEAYKVIEDPIRKRHVKALSCEIGIPEVCR